MKLSSQKKAAVSAAVAFCATRRNVMSFLSSLSSEARMFARFSVFSRNERIFPFRTGLWNGAGILPMTALARKK